MGRNLCKHTIPTLLKAQIPVGIGQIAIPSTLGVAMNDIHPKACAKNWYEPGNCSSNVEEYRRDPATGVTAMRINHPKGNLVCSSKGEIVLIQNTTPATLPSDIIVLGKSNQYSIGPGGIFVSAPWSQKVIALNRPLNLVSISISASFIEKCSQMDLLEFQKRTSQLYTASLVDPYSSRAMQSIWDELGSDKAHSRLLIDGTTCVLLGSILRNAESLSVSNVSQFPEQDMVRVADTIETNLDNLIRFEDLAEMCGLSLAGFQSTFKISFGMSPRKYIMERRVIRAKTLVTQSQESFAGIAAACGFYDQSHMIHTFKRQFGYTPGKLRESVSQ